jgi:hypothetical protein
MSRARVLLKNPAIRDEIIIKDAELLVSSIAAKFVSGHLKIQEGSELVDGKSGRMV